MGCSEALVQDISGIPLCLECQYRRKNNLLSDLFSTMHGYQKYSEKRGTQAHGLKVTWLQYIYKYYKWCTLESRSRKFIKSTCIL